MLDFEKKVAAYIREHRMFPEHGKVLVALSGGGDSVALLHCLVRIRGELGITLEAAHLNHSLRGGESDGDERFCREVCERLGAPLTVECLEKGALDRTGESLETAARKARREFLTRTARFVGTDRIATGHTRDDQAETVLQRIIRGSGPTGLAGILPVSEGIRVRPLLGMSRRSARAYLDEIGESYREDSTNLDTAVFRNRVRHVLIPLLEEEFSPGAADALARLADLSREQEEYLAGTVGEAYRACLVYEDSGKILLDESAFGAYHTMLRTRVVRRCLERLEGEGRDTDREEVSRICALIAEGRKETEVTSRVRCAVWRGSVVFAVRPSAGGGPVRISVPGETEVSAGGKIAARALHPGDGIDGRRSVIVDPRLMERYGDLTVGFAARGERMIPFGRKSPVAIRDILSESSVPGILRESVPVVRAGGVPVWIPGVRSSECLRTERAGSAVLFLGYSGGPEWSRLFPKDGKR
jgi:tRNA(Ile)-lysidine synthase